MSTDVFVIVQPTVNGPLHVGHLSGPYLAADVAIRAARLRGDDVLAVAGVDKHQNYVAARIAWDTFLDPVTDPAFGPAVAALLTDLLDSDAVELRETELHRCTGCGR